MSPSTVIYDELLAKVQWLAPAEQLRLLEQLAMLVRQQLAAQYRHSILELQGLGKELWQNIDAQEYVDQERTSWNG